MSHQADNYHIEPVAIVGIGCRYPGEVNDLNSFWKTVAEKKDLIGKIPTNRMGDTEFLVDPNRTPGKIVNDKGAYLNDIEKFDAEFFGISPLEAKHLDPQQRLLLEIAFEAVENSGIKHSKLSGSKTGVYIGLWTNDFEHRLSDSGDDLDVYSTTGSGRYAASGRISFFLNLQGPAITLDTACSSSLVAVHLAVQSIQSGETEMAFAGAANVILDPIVSIGYSRSGLLSEYGRCKFGAADPRGYVRSEGAGMVLLKKLSKAIEDGDQIHAIIPGSTCNNDGQSDKYMLAPSWVTQEIMIRDAHKRFGIHPKDVQYIEAHGTGTKAGDPAEIKSVSNALAEGRNKDDVFYMGSVKTNFGHTEGAAGMAGLIKAVLSIKERKILPNLFTLPANPEIPWNEYLVRIPDQLTDWPKPDQPLIAGVNAFGIAGTNAHVILKEFTAQPKSTPVHKKPDNYLLPLSAANDAGLKAYAEHYKIQLEKLPEDEFQKFAFNIAQYKSDLAFRKAISAPSKEAILDALNAIAQDEVSENVVEGYFANDQKPKVAFVFPGQGSQWLGMGKELYDNQPIFKSAIDDCEQAFKKYVNWSLTEELFSKDPTAMSTIDVIQPALVAVEIALAKMWQSYGIQPDAVVGHSMGEVAAAYISGSITLDEAAAVICHRSRLMKTTSGQGAMGYVALTSDEMKSRLNGNEKVSIAVQNSPKSVVVSGDTQTLETLLEKWDNEGIFCRKVKVDVASHSPQMDPITEELKQSVAHLSPSSAIIPFWSTVQHQLMNGEDLTADYWVTNLRQPVKFADTIQNMLAEGTTIFIEMSPHPVLTQAIAENIEHVKATAQTFGSIEREVPELQKLQLNIGRAFCSGIHPNWASLYNGSFVKTELPNYPWQKEYYWPDESRGKTLNNTVEKRNGQLAHPFLAKKTELPEEDGTIIWESFINTLKFSYLKDHLVHETVVFPAAGYVEIALAALEESFGPGDHAIENFEFKEAISIPEKGNIQLQVLLKRKIGNSYTLLIRSKAENDKQWNNNGRCSILVNYNKDLSPINAVAKTDISADDHYDFTKKMGLPYGPLFQTVQSIHHDDKVWIGDIKVDESILPQIKRYGLHPTLLDGCLQVALNVSRHKVSGATYVPVYIEHLYVADSVSEIDHCRVIIEEHASGSDWIDTDLIVKQNDQVLLKMIGFKMKKLESIGSENTSIDDLLYQVEWDAYEFKNQKAADQSLVLKHKAKDTIAEVEYSGSTKSINFNDANVWSSIAQESDGSTIEFHAFNTSEGSFSIEKFYSDQATYTFGLTQLLQQLSKANKSPKIILVTKACQSFENDQPNLNLAPLWGMGRVILNEHPEFNFTRIDLSNKPSLQEAELLQKIIQEDTTENEWVIRNNKAYVARLDHYSTQDKSFTKSSLSPANGKAYKAIIDQPGVIDNLSFREIIRTAPAQDEVEVEVKALGINFMNLMSVLGIYPGKDNGFATLGIECSGVVTKVGKNVDHLSVGDEVLGMAYDSMASHVILHAGLLRKKPSYLNFQEAATIPAVFLTSYYALVYLGRLKKGERVLIHSATGGVGLSAIQIAKAIGAEIFATAGTKEKRDLLVSLGVDHVYDSRTLDFAAQIKIDTNGEGIDIVLNSLTGEAMIRSMELLRSFGRFLEIGKKDVYENSRLGLSVFDKAISYSMIDLEKMLFETPAFLGELLEEVLKHFESGTYQPLQFQSFGVSEVKKAFEFMSKAKHLGKIIINVDQENPSIELLQHPKTVFSADATYLLTGGYGGLGITFADWMVNQGARNLILVGRSGPKAFAQKTIDAWAAKGANINVVKTDVSSRSDLKQIIDAIPSDQPLKGVMHLAGILDDAAVSNLHLEQYERVLQPKVNGAWYLHELTHAMDLDFFVLFSSSALLFGSPGQAAYVAANAYLDQLAATRKMQGLEALSINWGTVSDVGLAAEADNRADRLAEEGVLSLSPNECIDIYATIADVPSSSIGAFRFDLNKWQQAYLTAAKNPFFEHLRSDIDDDGPIASDSFIEELRTINNEDSLKETIQQKLKELVGGVVKKAADKINIKTPFKSLGIDSLMSIQLKNKLETAFETPISVTSFWTYSNIRDYTKFLMDELDLGGDENSSTDGNETKKEIVETKTTVIEEVSIEDISDDDISDLLAAELDDL